MALLSAVRSIRRFCLECQGNSSRAVRQCPDFACPLWDWRLPDSAGKTPALRVIRRQCLLCAGSRGDVRQCRAKGTCPLWSYRFGVRPETYRLVHLRFSAPKPLTLF